MLVPDVNRLRRFLVLSWHHPSDWKIGSECDWNKGLAGCEALLNKDQYKRRMPHTALERGLDLLQQRGLIDPAKVGITGLSAGAETVSYALFHTDRIAAAAHSGDWTPINYYLNPHPFIQDIIKRTNDATTGPEAVEKWKAASLVFNADKVQAPLLLRLADHEALSNMPQVVALRDAGKPVEVYIFPDEYHIKWQPQHKLAIYDRTIDWFRFWLKDEEDPMPAKIDQYRRWRVLRQQQHGTMSKESS